jgi:hypothetical protein
LAKVRDLTKKTSKKCGPGECAWRGKEDTLDKKCMVGVLGGRRATCPTFNGGSGRRSCAWARLFGGVPTRRKKKNSSVQDRILKGLGMGARGMGGGEV